LVETDPREEDAMPRTGPWAVAVSGGLLSTLVSLPLALDAQVGVVIPSEVACRMCEIALTPITTLGKVDDEVALRHDSRLAIDPERRLIYVAQTYVPGTLFMYGWDGDRLASFGRAGQGPGEFGASPLGLAMDVDEAGNLHVVEYGRRTVVGPELEGLVRTHPIGIRFDDALVLGSGALVGASSVLRVGVEAHRFVVMDALGAEARPVVEMPAEPAPVMLARSQDGGFWASHVYEYRIEKYRADGSLDRVVRRSAEWFAPYRLDDRGPAFSRPTVSRVYEDEEGRLWTLVRVPAADRAAAERVLGSGALRLDDLDWSAVQDSRIEVLDPETGRLLASFRSDRALLLLEGGYVVDRITSPEGLIQFAISALSLVNTEELP
jgi:hypothetical protein